MRVSVFLAHASIVSILEELLNGNGTMVLEYDAENQLTNAFVAGSWMTQCNYDFAGRLRQRWENIWNGSSWLLVTPILRYVCDGMVVLQERNEPGGTVLVGYPRGPDLSGTGQGAGGIGGLLSRTQHTGTGAGTGYYHSDGNGNVTAILVFWRRPPSCYSCGRKLDLNFIRTWGIQ